MKRILIDTQSNRLLRNHEVEQRYDQRGGLCQVGEGHVMLTVDPVDPAYLDYWHSLGFSLPQMLTAGPYEKGKTLGDLVLRKPQLQGQLQAHMAGESRLEFYCIEQAEKQVAQVLGARTYCNFDVSIRYARKLEFKRLCQELGLPTVTWFYHEDPAQVEEAAARWAEEGIRSLVKADDGMGGTCCGGMRLATSPQDVPTALKDVGNGTSKAYIEQFRHDLAHELFVFWEMAEDGSIASMDVLDAVFRQGTLVGSSWPSRVSDALHDRLAEGLIKLTDFLRSKGGVGYYCCDVLVDRQGNIYWSDFNPRKGASLFILDVASRLGHKHHGGRRPHFWHERFAFGSVSSDDAIEQCLELLGPLTKPCDEGYVVLTNPGVIPYGRIELTGISPRSVEDARIALQQAAVSLRALV